MAAASEIVVGLDASMPPFATDDGLSVYGLDIDLAHAIALRIDRTDAWKLVNHALTALKENHELDIIIADWL